jgi:hypothetical protein
MTTSTAKQRDEKLIEVLEKTKKLYRMAIEMDFEKQQRLILEYIQGLVKPHPDLACIGEACQKTLEEYPKGMPHDSTLIIEARKLVKHPYSSLFPSTSFDEDILIYKMYDYLIKDLFDTIPKEEFNRHEQFVIEKLWRGVHCTLVDNPNFKGDNPYYKRHYSDMRYSKKQWLKLLDEDFNGYIEYFKEEEEGE